jgi:hypothetical protein
MLTWHTSCHPSTLTKEIVARFCDKEDNADRCDKFQTALTDGMEVRIAKAGNDETEVEVEVPAVEAAATSRRLAGLDTVHPSIYNVVRTLCTCIHWTCVLSIMEHFLMMLISICAADDDAVSLLEAALADPDATDELQISAAAGTNTVPPSGNGQSVDIAGGNGAHSLSISACAIMLVCGTMAVVSMLG